MSAASNDLHCGEAAVFHVKNICTTFNKQSQACHNTGMAAMRATLLMSACALISQKHQQKQTPDSHSATTIAPARCVYCSDSLFVQQYAGIHSLWFILHHSRVLGSYSSSSTASSPPSSFCSQMLNSPSVPK